MSLPGATRLTLFGACPWLSYFAPLALIPDFIFAPLVLNQAFIFRGFGAQFRDFVQGGLLHISFLDSHIAVNENSPK